MHLVESADTLLAPAALIHLSRRTLKGVDTARIETTGAQVYQHTHPAFESGLTASLRAAALSASARCSRLAHNAVR